MMNTASAMPKVAVATTTSNPSVVTSERALPSLPRIPSRKFFRQ